MSTISDKLNGKKLPLSAIAGVILAVITGLMGYATLKADVISNKEAVKALKDEPIKIARLEQDMASVMGDVGEIKAEQIRQRESLKQILMAVTK